MCFPLFQGDDGAVVTVQGAVCTSLTCIFPAGLFGYYIAGEDVRVHDGVAWAKFIAATVVVCVILGIYYMACVYQ